MSLNLLMHDPLSWHAIYVMCACGRWIYDTEHKGEAYELQNNMRDLDLH